MLLRSHQSFSTLANYDPFTGSFATFSRNAERAGGVTDPCEGSFDTIGKHRVLLFRSSDVLYLEVDYQRLPMDGLIFELANSQGNRLLRITKQGVVLHELVYSNNQLPTSFADDPTAFAEEEDFDFGLFLVNLSQDKARQERIYQRPPGGASS
jgi:hypothetical protein